VNPERTTPVIRRPHPSPVLLVPAWVSINASVADRAGKDQALGPAKQARARRRAQEPRPVRKPASRPAGLTFPAIADGPALGVLTRNRNEKENDNGT